MACTLCFLQHHQLFHRRAWFSSHLRQLCTLASWPCALLSLGLGLAFCTPHRCNILWLAIFYSEDLAQLKRICTSSSSSGRCEVISFAASCRQEPGLAEVGGWSSQWILDDGYPLCGYHKHDEKVYLKILATHDVSSMQRFVCP